MENRVRKIIVRDTVATRVLTRDERTDKILVAIGRPKKRRSEWECEFMVGTHIDRSKGVDSMQALITAIQAIRAFLDSDALGLHWFSSEFGTEIPHFATGYGRKFEAKIARLMEREKAKVWKSRTKIRQDVIDAA